MVAGRPLSWLCLLVFLFGSLAVEAVEVDEFTGEAVFTLPLVVPPGAGGLTPDLALEYRSGSGRGGAGVLGFGWGLRGASAITRSVADGVPYDYGAWAAGTTCGGTPCYRDDYAVDGEPLVCAVWPCDGSYRMRRDTGASFTLLGEQKGWERLELDGTLFRYGTTADSRLLNPRSGQVFAWLLEEIQDVHGNWIRYEYDERSPGVRYLVGIRYAQAGAGANRRVELVLEPREDRAIDYRAGFRQQVDQRVARIDVRAAGDELVARYELAYAQSPDSGRSLLTGVQRVGSDGVTPTAPFTSGLPPHRFSYTESERALSVLPTSFCPQGYPCGGTGLDEEEFPRIAVADMNRDGLADVYQAWSGVTVVGLSDGREIASPLAFDAPVWVAESARPADGPATELVAVDALVTDVNGDGYPDWLRGGQVVAGPPVFELHLGTAAGFAAPLPPKLPSGPTQVLVGAEAFYVTHLVSRSTDGAGTSSSYDGYLHRTLLDLTGDGRPEIVWARAAGQAFAGGPPAADGEWLVSPVLGVDDATGQPLWSPDLVLWADPFSDAVESSHTIATESWHRTLTLDVNADGLPDRVHDGGTATPQWWVAYNNGAGFEAPELWFALAAPAELHPRAASLGSFVHSDLLDLNGDGFVDHVVAAGNSLAPGHPGFSGLASDGWMVRLGSGSHLQADFVRWGGTGEPADPLINAAVREDLAFVHGRGLALPHRGGLSDLNGDGLLDRYTTTLFESYLQRGTRPDLLASGRSPSGGRFALGYATSAQLRETAGELCDSTRECRFTACIEGRCMGGPRPAASCGADDECGVCEGAPSWNFCADDAECTWCLGGRPANPGLAPPRPVVALRTLSAERAGVPELVTAFHFADGAVDAENRFAGFGSFVRRELDSDGATLASHTARFHTDLACSGAPAALEQGSATELLRRVAYEYARPSGPDHPAATAEQRFHGCLELATTESAIENDEASARHRRTELDYGEDPLGTHYNVLEIRDLGEVDVDGADLDSNDDRITQLEYTTPASTGAPTSLPSEIRISSGTGEILAHTRFRYDGLAAGAVERGLVTAVERWLSEPQGGGRWIEARASYDAYGNRTAALGPATADDPNGLQNVYGYDDVYATFLVSRTDGADLGSGALHTDYTHDACASPAPAALGLPCRVVDARGAAVELDYDALGRVVERRRPGGLVERRRYVFPDENEAGQLLEETELLLAGKAPLLYERWADGLGRAYRETAPGRDQERIAVERVFDARGLAVQETLPHFAGDSAGTVRFEHDALGRLSLRQSADGTTQTLYSRVPWIEIEEVYFENERQRRVERAFDARAQLVEHALYTDASGLSGRLSARADYDALGRVIGVLDADANAITLGWDTLSRRVRIASPDTGERTYSFDDAGLLIARTDGAGRVQRYRYDSLRRPVRREFEPAGAGSVNASLIYGNNPADLDFARLVAVTPDGDGTHYAFAYDEEGRIIRNEQTTFGQHFATDYEHDELGRLSAQRFPDGERFTYRYDGTRLVGLESDELVNGGSLHVLLDAAYDARGRTLRLDLPGVALERAYAPGGGRLERIRATGAEAETALDLALEFDGLDRLETLDGSVNGAALGLRTFGYDGAGQLRSAHGPWEAGPPVTWTYAYDALGNRTEQRSTGMHERCFGYDAPGRPRFLSWVSDCQIQLEQLEPDAAGRPRERNGAAYAWNSQGRLHAAAAGGHARHHYDAFDRLAGTRFTGGVELIRVGEDYEFDTLLGQANKFFHVNGERIATRATLHAAVGQAAATSAWPADPGLLAAGLGIALVAVAGLAVAGQKRRRAAWAAPPGIGLLCLGLLLWPTGRPQALGGPESGPSWFGSHRAPLLVYAADHLGSTRAVFDAGGAVVETRDYGPFGRTIRHDGDYTLKHRFAGQPVDATGESQLHGARRYEPNWGRFLSPDERVEAFSATGLNPYTYARNQPTSRIDRDGRYSIGWYYNASSWDLHWSAAARGAIAAEGGRNAARRAFDREQRITVENMARRIDLEVKHGALPAGVRRTGPTPTASGSAEIGGSSTLKVVVGLGEIVFIDVFSMSLGLASNVNGVAIGVYEVLQGIARLDVARIGRGFADIGNALVPRYGFHAGPGHWSEVVPLSVIGRATAVHDRAYAETDRIFAPEMTPHDLRLVRDIYADQLVGPFGQVYRLGVAGIFLAKIGLQGSEAGRGP